MLLYGTCVTTLLSNHFSPRENRRCEQGDARTSRASTKRAKLRWNPWSTSIEDRRAQTSTCDGHRDILAGHAHVAAEKGRYASTRKACGGQIHGLSWTERDMAR